MYGRSSNTNLFARTINQPTSNGANIFNTNNKNIPNNTYGTNNLASNYNPLNNYSSNKIGSARVIDYASSKPPRLLEDISVKWKTNDLNPISIVARP